MKEQEKLNELVLRRGRIAFNYCVSKGWPTDPAELTIEQIMEIRSQENWKYCESAVSPPSRDNRDERKFG